MHGRRVKALPAQNGFPGKGVYPLEAAAARALPEYLQIFFELLRREQNVYFGSPLPGRIRGVSLPNS
jgi:hypothetical protein